MCPWTFRDLAQAPLRERPENVQLFLSQPGGINTAVGANQLNKNQLVTAINWYYDNTGALTTRPGLTKTTNIRINGNVISQGFINISGTTFHIIQDSDFNIYKIVVSEPVLIGQLTGQASIIQYNQKGVFLDSGYIKTWDGTNLRLAYDTATYLQDYTNGTEAGFLAYTANKYDIGVTFTTPAFGSINIAFKQALFTLKKTGSPTGTLKAVLVLKSDMTVVETSTAITNTTTGASVSSASDLITSPVAYKAAFSTAVLKESTEYYIYLEHTTSDASNYVQMSYADSGTGDGKLVSNTLGVWSEDTTKTALIAAGAALPPKAASGVVKAYRLFTIGSPDKPGYVYYSNVNDINDWTTDNGSGYLGIGDNDPYSYPAGGIIQMFGSIWIIGKPEHPYFVQITGSSPSDFAVDEKFKAMETNSLSVANAINDGLFTSASGVYSISGVKQYGDLRFSNLASNIRNYIHERYTTSTAFARYNPDYDQYWLQLDNTPFVLIGHKGLISQTNSGVEIPWTFYRFANKNVKSFVYHNGSFYIGFDDGFVYELDADKGTDDGTDIDYNLLSGVEELALQEGIVSDYYVAGTVYGSQGKVTMRFYAGADATGDDIQLESGLQLETGLEIGHTLFYNEELDLSVIPYDRAVDYTTRSLQVGITNHINTGRLYLTGIALQVRNLAE